MRFTESQIRRIVREEILRESRIKDLFDKVKDDPRGSDGKPVETRIPAENMPPDVKLREIMITVRREYTEYTLYIPSESPDEVRVLRGRIENRVLGDTNHFAKKKIVNIGISKGAFTSKLSFETGLSSQDK